MSRFNIKQALLDTKQKLRQKGWAQSAITPSGKVCLVVAMWSDSLSQAEYEEVKAHFLWANGMPPKTSLVFWNDNRDRTEAQVLQALDRAILACDTERSINEN